MVAAICLVVLAMSLQTLALENSELKDDKLAVGVRDAAKDAGGERRQLKQHSQSGERGLGPHKAPPLSASARRPGLAPATDAAIVAFLNKVGMTWEDVKHEEALRWLGKGINDTDCKTIAHLIASGSLGSLQKMDLGYNKIGDAGMIDFSRAIASGSLRSLTWLDIEGNQIGAAGMIEFSRAIASGSLGKLEFLGLGRNQIGDQGLKALAEAIGSGSMANLKNLYLFDNKFTQTGKTAIMTAATKQSISCSI